MNTFSTPIQTGETTKVQHAGRPVRVVTEANPADLYLRNERPLFDSS